MDVLLYMAATLTAVWGLAHLFATRGVVQGFGELSADNRRIITMEWIVEGIALLTLGALIAAVTVVDSNAAAASAAYAVAVAALLALAVVSLFTGFHVAFLPFRMCPVIFVLSAVLTGLGAWL
ncbi:MAG: hypothetical protein FJW35_05810 [Acidobacteria bacterium]|nr:hypothetical protein [Acidobacteriota bacterium]